MKIRILSLVGLFAFALAAESVTLTGQVFHDANGNGRFDAGEKGMSGITVSDGIDMAKTDSAGKFALKSRPGQQYVYISAPSDYRAANGFYRKITDGQTAYDFPLTKHSAPDCFLQLSDIEAEKEASWQATIKAELKRRQYAFMIITGDIAKNRKEGLIYAAGEYTEANYGTPIYFLPGNHDWCPGTPGKRNGEQDFLRELGPLWYSFNVNGVHFIVTPMLWSDSFTWAVKRAPGYTAADIFDWVKKDLESLTPETPVVIFSHDNILSEPSVAKVIDFSKYNITGHIYGHHHINATAKINGIACFCQASPIGGSNSAGGYSVYNFERQGTLEREVRYFAATRLCATVDRRNMLTLSLYESSPEIKNIQAKSGGKTFDLKRLNAWTWQCQLPDGISSGELLADGSALGEFSSTPMVEYVLNGGSRNGYFSSILYSQGVLYLGESDDANGAECGVRAYDPDGKLLWRFKSDNSVKGDMAVAGGTLLFCDAAETLYALSLRSGKEMWRKMLWENSYGTYAQGVAAEGDAVFAGRSNAVGAYSVGDGKEIWRKKDGVDTGREYAGQHFAANGVLVVQGAGGDGGRLRAYDAATGQLLWEVCQKGEYFKTAPVTRGNSLFAGINHHVHEFDLKTGEILNKYYVSYINRVRTSFAVTDRRLVSGSPFHGVFGHYRDAEKKHWRFTPDKNLTLNVNYMSAPNPSVQSKFLMPDSNTVIFGGDDGKVYALNVNDGKLLWLVATGAPVTGIALGEGAVYAINFAGNLYKIKLTQ